MKEIAEAAGVSISTVSLVLNGRDEGRVKAPLAALVREKADELGYTVNPLARSLRTCRTRILGFISEEVATTPYAGGIILGAQDAASTYGYMIITVSTDGRASEENEIATLKRYGVDGFFYSKMSNRIASVPASLGDYPVVMVDATDADNQIPSIEPDEFQIAYDATKRLIQADCKRIAYIGCSENMIAQDGRFPGIRRHCRIPVSPMILRWYAMCSIMVLRCVPSTNCLTNAIPTVSFVSMMRAHGMCTNVRHAAD